VNITLGDAMRLADDLVRVLRLFSVDSDTELLSALHFTVVVFMVGTILEHDQDACLHYLKDVQKRLNIPSPILLKHVPLIVRAVEKDIARGRIAAAQSI